ncbi:hypothetical protein N825_15200 [Skermanella stibiiresistens SB22]|uniref:Uncharacterized protein n=1 Tax=Skermanella stibiiresistens SB22 TaxID=1385369 RepID=W9H038_9PROT|nr:hypothetical protein N825_15200 [Skermanella stibiiresistens SB22]
MMTSRALTARRMPIRSVAHTIVVMVKAAFTEIPQQRAPFNER